MVKHVFQVMEHSEPVAKGAVLTAFGSTGIAWLGPVNDVLTAIATIVAIISGLFASRFYYLKAKSIMGGTEEKK